MGFGLSELVIVVVFLIGSIFIIGISSDTAKTGLDTSSQEYEMVNRSTDLFAGLLSVNGFIILIFGIMFLVGALKALGNGGHYR